VPWASKIDTTSDLADIAKTYENLWFLMVLEGWRLTLEAWRSSWLSCWLAGWQLAGWLAGWLLLAGRLAGHRDPQDPETMPSGRLKALSQIFPGAYINQFEKKKDKKITKYKTTRLSNWKGYISYKTVNLERLHELQDCQLTRLEGLQRLQYYKIGKHTLHSMMAHKGPADIYGCVPCWFAHKM